MSPVASEHSHTGSSHPNIRIEEEEEYQYRCGDGHRYFRLRKTPVTSSKIGSALTSVCGSPQKVNQGLSNQEYLVWPSPRTFSGDGRCSGGHQILVLK